MSVMKTLKVSGNSRPTVKDLASALELLKEHGAPESQLVTASTHVGGVWSLEVKWDPTTHPAADPAEDLEPAPEADINPSVPPPPRDPYGTRKT